MTTTETTRHSDLRLVSLFSSQVEEVYETTPYRWFILLQFVLVTMSSGFLMVTFSGIATTVAKVYGVSVLLVNGCIMAFLVAYIVLNFPSIHIVEKFGLKRTVSDLFLLIVKIALGVRIVPYCGLGWQVPSSVYVR